MLLNNTKGLIIVLLHSLCQKKEKKINKLHVLFCVYLQSKTNVFLVFLNEWMHKSEHYIVGLSSAVQSVGNQPKFLACISPHTFRESIYYYVTVTTLLYRGCVEVKRVFLTSSIG